VFLQQFLDSLFVLRRTERPQQTGGDRLDAVVDERLDGFQHLVVVETLHDAVTVRPLGEAPNALPGNERVGLVGVDDVFHLLEGQAGPAPVPSPCRVQCLLEPRCRQQAGFRALPLEQRVLSHGGSVEEQFRLLQQFLEPGLHVLRGVRQGIEDTPREVRIRREVLADGYTP
jgi:hypothetical protein